MLLKFNTQTPAFVVQFAGRDDVSLALLCATTTEAQALVDESAKKGRAAAVVPVTILITERAEAGKPSDKL